MLRRATRLAVGHGGVVSYVHNALGPGLGKIGVWWRSNRRLPRRRSPRSAGSWRCMSRPPVPLYLDIASVPPAALERERDVLREQARATGKADGIIEQMVEGRLRKFYEEVVLLEQIFVIDGETRVAKVVEEAAKAAGAPIAVAGFARFALGEGIERNRTDFAAEVAAATQVKH